MHFAHHELLPRIPTNTELFHDERINEELSRVGYSIVGPTLDQGTIDTLSKFYLDMMERFPVDLVNDTWFTTGSVEDPRIRNEVFNQVGSLVKPSIRELVIDSAQLLAGHFHVNPVSAQGGLGPHQDVGMLDEQIFSSVNGWIPLVDSKLSNGTLHLVPGSHRFGNFDRSLTIPWAYHGLHDLFWEFAQPVEVQAGELLVFDTAMVHCSSTNRSTSDRVAINCLILPEKAHLRQLVPVEASESDMIEIYDIESEFYLNHGVTSQRGAASGRLVDIRPVHIPRIEPMEVRRQCESGAQL